MTRRILGAAMAAIGTALLVVFAAFIAWAQYMYAPAVTPRAAITTILLVFFGGLIVAVGLKLALTGSRE